MRRALPWMVLLALLAISSLTGCQTAKTPCQPEIVYVPVYEPPPELPLPDAPEWATCAADPADWQEYLRAMTQDLLSAWAYVAELRHVIEAYNASRPAPEPAPTE